VVKPSFISLLILEVDPKIRQSILGFWVCLPVFICNTCEIAGSPLNGAPSSWSGGLSTRNGAAPTACTPDLIFLGTTMNLTGAQLWGTAGAGVNVVTAKFSARPATPPPMEVAASSRGAPSTAEPPGQLKTWRPDYSKASWTPPGAPPPSRCPRCRTVLVCFGAVAAMLSVAGLLGWFERQKSPPPLPLSPPIPPPVPGPPHANITSAPGVVTVTWVAVDGAVGYLLQEWNWNRLDDRGWYSVRALDGEEGEFMFRFGYGSIELPRCGTVIPVPHASIRVAGRAGLRLEWRVRSVGPTGALSAWSVATNAVDMPRWQGEPLDNNCQQCSAGNHDDDENAETLCKPCNAGTFAAVGSVNCTACPPGRADLDINSGTPCELCPKGSSAKGTLCAVCEPGYSDYDRDPATECTPCPAGSYSSHNATSCTECPAGLHDWDTDPSTACTACPSCAPGECPIGTHLTRSADADSPISCTPCIGTLVDHDADPLTECQVCKPGTERSSTQFGAARCSLCAPGKTDRDSNASSPCSTCLPGRYSDAAGSVGNCSICATGKSSESGAKTADACYHIGLAPSVRTALVVVAVAVALATAAMVVVLVVRFVLSAKSGAQEWWVYRRTHRVQVHNYDAGEDIPAIVPKPSSWLQDVLLLMKRVDSTVHQASITEDVPQHPRPSAMTSSVIKASTDANVLDRGEKTIARVLVHWEAQYSGAVTGTARQAVALAVAAKREKKPCDIGQDSNAVIKELRAEGLLSYSRYKPTLPKLSAAQHEHQIFKDALHASRTATHWQPHPSPGSRAVICNACVQPYTARPKRSCELPPLRSTNVSRFSALEKAILSERLKDLERLESHEPVQSDLNLAADAAQLLESLDLQHWSNRLAQLGTTVQDLLLLQRRDMEALGFEGTELRRFAAALNQLQPTTANSTLT
jgi:hypothetical protein